MNFKLTITFQIELHFLCVSILLFFEVTKMGVNNVDMYTFILKFNSKYKLPFLIETNRDFYNVPHVLMIAL